MLMMFPLSLYCTILLILHLYAFSVMHTKFDTYIFVWKWVVGRYHLIWSLLLQTNSFVQQKCVYSYVPAFVSSSVYTCKYRVHRNWVNGYKMFVFPLFKNVHIVLQLIALWNTSFWKINRLKTFTVSKCLCFIDYI